MWNRSGRDDGAKLNNQFFSTKSALLIHRYSFMVSDSKVDRNRWEVLLEQTGDVPHVFLMRVPLVVPVGTRLKIPSDQNIIELKNSVFLDLKILLFGN